MAEPPYALAPVREFRFFLHTELCRKRYDPKQAPVIGVPRAQYQRGAVRPEQTLSGPLSELPDRLTGRD